jgi:hypothetical protein
MKSLAKMTAVALVAALFASTSNADGRTPGSVLIYPVQRSLNGSFPGVQGVQFTVLNVTNTNLTPAIGGNLGGSTNIMFEYVNMMYDPPPFSNRLKPAMCSVVDIVDFLTPADTYSVLTQCHNNGQGQEGYVVLTAQDPALFKSAWSFNYLIGSELVVMPTGGVYQIDAQPFDSLQAENAATDVDGDGQLDFDGIEYEGTPDELYIDSVLAVTSNSLVLINLTGGTEFLATVKFDAWNNDEYPMSTTKAFKCWFEVPLFQLDNIFTPAYLFFNTPSALDELDVNCDGVGDFDTFWARIRGIVASSAVESIPDPAILGALTASGAPLFEGGKSLWESPAKQFNGDFLKFGTDDPEN